MIINVNKPLLKLGWELVPNLDDQILLLASCYYQWLTFDSIDTTQANLIFLALVCIFL